MTMVLHNMLARQILRFSRFVGVFHICLISPTWDYQNYPNSKTGGNTNHWYCHWYRRSTIYVLGDHTSHCTGLGCFLVFRCLISSFALLTWWWRRRRRKRRFIFLLYDNVGWNYHDHRIATAVCHRNASIDQRLCSTVQCCLINGSISFVWDDNSMNPQVCITIPLSFCLDWIKSSIKNNRIENRIASP